MTGQKARQPADLSDILALMHDEYGYSLGAATALHENMSIYAYGLALGMNTGIFNMTEGEIAARLAAPVMALTSVYGAPKKQIKEKNEANTERSEKELWNKGSAQERLLHY